MVDPSHRGVAAVSAATALGLAWGLLLAAPVVSRARRLAPATRLGALGTAAPAPVRPVAGGAAAAARALGEWWRRGMVARVWDSVAGRRRRARAESAIEREIPVAVDLLGVAVGAGCTPYLALEVAARWAPPAIAVRLAGVLRACALGRGFDAALDDAALATPSLRPLADALLASDRLGAPVGPVLARLAAEERTALQRRAEAHTRRIPVRLLFPLVFLVLPAFVLLTVVPGLAAGMARL